MKKILLSGILSLSLGMPVMAQTTATDFTATDCNGNSHNLFNTMDSGKVVVLVWVMPCSMCENDAKAAYDAAKSFQTSNPGQVLFWLSDDAGNTSCASLNAWASSKGIGNSNIVTFGNSGNPINESNFGGSGMPHVVVMANKNHQIYFNKRNGSNDGAAITSAINSALSPMSNSNMDPINSPIRISPNPLQSQSTLQFSLQQAETVTIQIFNAIGVCVESMDCGLKTVGQHSLALPISDRYPSGCYFIRLNCGASSQMVKCQITDPR